MSLCHFRCAIQVPLPIIQTAIGLVPLSFLQGESSAQFQCQTLALLSDSPGTTAPARDHHFLDKEQHILDKYKSRDQGIF